MPDTPGEAPQEPGFQAKGNSDVDKLAQALFHQGTQPVEPLRQPAPLVPETANRPPAAPELRSAHTAPPPEPTPEPPAEPPEPEVEAQPPEGQEPEGEEPAGTEEDPLVEVVVDGETSEVPISQVIGAYQQQAAITQRSMRLADERKAFEAQMNEVAQASANQSAQVSQLIQALTYEVNRTQPSPEQWEQLRKEDPGEYAARKADFDNRQRTIQAAQYQQAQIAQAEMARRVPQERAALAAKHPEFAKDFDGTYSRLGKWVVGEGFLTAEQWDQIIDHRHVDLVYRAYKGETTAQATRTRVPQVTRKLAKTPKVVRPGTQVEPGQAAAEEYDAAIARARERGTTRAVADAFLARERLKRESAR